MNTLDRHPVLWFIPVLLLTVLVFLNSGCLVKYHKDKIWHLRDKVVDLARSLEGCRYNFGGEDIDGFDCSGLVWYVYDCYGMQIPRNARKQRNAGRRIPLERALPGDILVFRTRQGFHSGIYLSPKEFIHAPNSESRVRFEILNSYWKRNLLGVVRVIRD